MLWSSKEKQQLAYQNIREMEIISLFEQKQQFFEQSDRFIGRFLDFCHCPM
jgi:hypothetical protein